MADNCLSVSAKLVRPFQFRFILNWTAVRRPSSNSVKFGRMLFYIRDIRFL